jgi:hypothetical protein
MNIPIFASEIQDGLADLINNNSIASFSVAKKAEPNIPFPQLKSLSDSELERLGIAKAENQNQLDLYYMQSVLVTTGWNKNDDVFDPQETWAARSSAEDKPFNFMHDEKDIIGHITSNRVVDLEGNLLSEAGESAPDQFEIVTSSVIYTEWSDPEQRDRINKLIAGINAGEWYVSMECLFPNFDYALIKGNEQKIIKRNETSAFLTKHLRSYGGDGKYEDYRVGRLLRNLAFSGKGLVSKPANPRSIILEGNDLVRDFSESIAQNLNLTKSKENIMPNSDLEKQVSTLQNELAEQKTANEALKDKVVAEQKAEYESQIEALSTQVTDSGSTLKEAEATISDLNQKLETLEETLASKEKDAEEKEKELKAMKKKEAMMKRKAQLEEVGLDAEVASATMEDFADVDDETFNKVVALMKKKAAMPDFIKKKMEDKKDDKKEDKKDDKKDGEAMKKGKYSEAENLEEQESKTAEEQAEAAEKALDTASTPTENAIASTVDEGEELQNMRSSASEWIGSFINSKTK